MSTPSSTIDKLADAYLAKAAERYGSTDSIAYLEAAAIIDDWRGVRKAVAELSAGASVTSYSIAGRSVTRADLPTLRDLLANLEGDLDAALGRRQGVLIADMTGGSR